MSIFTDIYNFGRKPVAVIGKVIKVALPIVKELIPGNKIINGISKVTKVIPKVKSLFNKGVKMNPLEKAVREWAEFYLSTKPNTQGLDKVKELFEGLQASLEVYKHVKGKPKNIWVGELKIAFDNLIGDEPNALIGNGDNVLLTLDIPMIGIEPVSDFLLAQLEGLIIDEGDEVI